MANTSIERATATRAFARRALAAILAAAAIPGILVPVPRADAAAAAAAAAAAQGVGARWLDEIIQGVVAEAKASARAGDAGASAAARGTGKLLVREADESLSAIARRAEGVAPAAARSGDRPSEAILEQRFRELTRNDARAAEVFGSLAPAEKRLVVEMGETARRVAARFPDNADELVRGLGTEGLAAVRVWGDDVAEVLAREGNQAVNVLRKTGRPGWNVYVGTVLPHKGKLAAAGVLAVFLANPEAFVDTAGNLTEYAAREFARAGIALAGAVAGGAARGVEGAIGEALAASGWNAAWARPLGVAAALAVIVVAALVLLGMPLRTLAAPLRWTAAAARGAANLLRRKTRPTPANETPAKGIEA